MKTEATIKPETALQERTAGSQQRVVRGRLFEEIIRCRQHEKLAKIQGLPSAEQAWRMRRWGISWAARQMKNVNAAPPNVPDQATAKGKL